MSGVISACRKETPETLLACTERAIYSKSQPVRTEWHAEDVRFFVYHVLAKARAAANEGRFSVTVPIVELENMGDTIDLASPPVAVIDEIRKDDPTVRVSFVGPSLLAKLHRLALVCSPDMRTACVHGAYVLDWRPLHSPTAK